MVWEWPGGSLCFRVVWGSLASNTWKWHGVVLGGTCLKAAAECSIMCCYKYLSWWTVGSCMLRVSSVCDMPCYTDLVSAFLMGEGQNRVSHFLQVCLALVDSWWGSEWYLFSSATTCSAPNYKTACLSPVLTSQRAEVAFFVMWWIVVSS